MNESVSRDGRFVTVSIGGVRATKEYADTWSARRAEKGLRESGDARSNFFRRPPQRTRR